MDQQTRPMQQPAQQMQLTEEQLRSMTPEQIAELQKQNCIFCHIVNEKVSSRKIYDDEKCIAILDINPANPGHTLLMPKGHYSIMPLLPDEDIKHIFNAAKKISHAMLKAFKAEGTNIFIANGIPAGQKAQHFMVHIIPRKEGDGIQCFHLPKNQANEEELDSLAKQLKPFVNNFLGIQKEVINLDKKQKEDIKIIGNKKEKRGKKEEEADLNAVVSFLNKPKED